MERLLYPNQPWCSFAHVIYEFMHGRVIYDPERLGSLSFNPITADNIAGPSLDLDPNQYFLSVSDSKYNTQDEFNSINYSPGLRFSHLCISLNVRSIRHNLSELTDFLTTSDNGFPIIGISETWLTSNLDDGVHRRTGNFFARGGGKPFAQKILASCQNFHETVGKKQGPYDPTT